MTSPTTRPEPSSASSISQGDLRAKAENAMSTIGDVAKQAAEEAKRSAATLASEANDKVKSILGKQVGAGADLVGHFAASARIAADDLDRNAPQIAGLVRDASQRIERFSQEIRGQTVDQLVRRTSDFARQRPAVMFGATAACGFFLFRLFKAGSGGTSRSLGSRPGEHDRRDGPGGSGHHPGSPSIAPHYGQ